MLQLIIDRNSSDIERAKALIEKAKCIELLTEDESKEYFEGLRGCYSITDLNRVENAVKVISEYLNELGYSNVVNTKTWNYGDLFNVSEIDRYLNNISILRNANVVYSNTPAVPTNYKPYINANSIEKILMDIQRIIVSIQTNYIYSGVCRSGQNRIWQKRFRHPIIVDGMSSELLLYTGTWQEIDGTDAQYYGEVTENLQLSLVSGNTKVSSMLDGWNDSLESIDEMTGGVVIGN